MYRIIPANTNLETLKKFVKTENNRSFEDGYDSDFRSESLKNVFNAIYDGNSHFHLISKDKEIIAIISSVMEGNIHLMKILYIANNADISDVYEALAESKDVVIKGDGWRKSEALKAGLTVCNNAIGEKKINFNSMGATFYTTGDPNAIINIFKKKFLDIKMGNVSYRVFTSSELDNYLIDTYKNKSEFWFLPSLTNSSNQSRFPGFHYFNFGDSNRHNDKIKYLCAFIGENIVGVIKFGVWPLDPGHQSVSFIDVHSALRGQGIATAMIKELNKYLDPTLPFHLTQESSMGRTCHMAKNFKANITSTDCFSYDELTKMAMAEY